MMLYHIYDVTIFFIASSWCSSSSVVNFLKLVMNVPWGILHRTSVGIYDLSKKTWLPLLKIDSSFSHIISPKLLGLAKFFQC